MSASDLPISHAAPCRPLPWGLSALGLGGAGIVILTVIPSIPGALSSLISTNWQLGLVFTLVGLILTILLSYSYICLCYLPTRQKFQKLDQIITISSAVVIMLGMGISACILAISPI